jgi:hypothetical protein
VQNAQLISAHEGSRLHILVSFLAARERNRFCFIEGAMRSQLFSEKSRSGRRRWLQVDEMPFSRAITYKLIDAGLISSVVVTWPGSRRGRRLIDGDSLDSYLESLTAKQAWPR